MFLFNAIMSIVGVMLQNWPSGCVPERELVSYYACFPVVEVTVSIVHYHQISFMELLNS